MITVGWPSLLMCGALIQFVPVHASSLLVSSSADLNGRK